MEVFKHHVVHVEHHVSRHYSAGRSRMTAKKVKQWHCSTTSLQAPKVSKCCNSLVITSLCRGLGLSNVGEYILENIMTQKSTLCMKTSIICFKREFALLIEHTIEHYLTSQVNTISFKQMAINEKRRTCIHVSWYLVTLNSIITLILDTAWNYIQISLSQYTFYLFFCKLKFVKCINFLCQTHIQFIWNFPIIRCFSLER